MFSTIDSGAVCGLQAYLVRVEVDLAGGLPSSDGGFFGE